MIEIADFLALMKYMLDRKWARIVVAIVVAITTICVVVTSAQALDQAEADANARNYGLSVCGSFFYKCWHSQFTRCDPTGVNKPKHPQWICHVHNVELKVRPLPFAPKWRLCSWSFGLTPWGKVIDSTHACISLILA